MKLTDKNLALSPVVHVDNTTPGLLYRYDFQPPGKRPIALYVLALDYSGGPMFADLVTGDLYNGDRGELRLLERAELILGRPE